ncbi:MAG: ATP-binding protein [Propionibacteriaceae bacterium]|jgi:predicted AAA+ superfamily ATPase|nr:ATP-binding protein [Propionibacteriaceae bacterium]
MDSLIARFAGETVRTALDDTRIVVIQGARQVGKSTLARQISAERNGLVVSLDRDEAWRFALDDPVGFVNQRPDGLLVIDEAQRAPALLRALKLAVDQDQRPGRYLVTGSADLLGLDATHESLAGRAETVPLYSLSQGELEGGRESFVDRAFAGQLDRGRAGGLTRADYLERACRGGYPEALARASQRRRAAWHSQYVTHIVRRDAEDVSNLSRLASLPQLLAMIAAQSGGEMVWNRLANDTEMPRRTLDPYVQLLQLLYLIHVVPAWSRNLSARQIKAPKVFCLDSGLAAGLLGVEPEGLAPTSPSGLAGGLLETFVAGELRRQLSWSSQSASLHHWRDRNGHEVDFVLEAPDGRIVAVEVKATASLTPKDLGGLARLGELLGEQFRVGVVLHTGSASQQVGRRLFALPLDTLWRQ